jgi:hypothetical protein
MQRELPKYDRVIEGMADSNQVVLRSEIIRIGHNRKLLGLTVLKAAPHVVRFLTSAEFSAVETLLELLRLGYTVEIRPAVDEYHLSFRLWKIRRVLA